MIVPVWNYVLAVIILFAILAFGLYGLYWSLNHQNSQEIDPKISN